MRLLKRDFRTSLTNFHGNFLAPRAAKVLRAAGYEVNTEPAPYRALMARKDERAWTHVHLRHGIRELTVSGPEHPQVAAIIRTAKRITKEAK